MAKPPLRISVGLEIHARLKTSHKIFCACSNIYGQEPNSQTCPVCLGLPGSLPVFNREILPLALRAALAFNCRISLLSEFSRKNYFYPDLPRNYQITQYDRPLAVGGYLEVGGKRVQFTRIHLEEDAGRSLRSKTGTAKIDLNRAGAPLIEIVTEPDFESGEQVRQWLNRLRQILRYLDVCDGNMENGSLRCDANVGFQGEHQLDGSWVELKNLNSFKWVGQAVDFEIQRLNSRVLKDEALSRETRAWDPHTRKTRLLRLKEQTAEYRFFPEPDLPLLVIEPSAVSAVKKMMPELPESRENRLHENYGIPKSESVTFCRSRTLADYFETCADALLNQTSIKSDVCGPFVSAWILSHVLAAVGGKDDLLPFLKLRPEKLAEILAFLYSETIHKTTARTMIDHVLNQPGEQDIKKMVQAFQLENEALGDLMNELCQQVVTQYPDKVAEYRLGKKGLINFLVGQVMSRSGGRLEAEKVRSILVKKLT